jgi:hypothetical protein
MRARILDQVKEQRLDRAGNGQQGVGLEVSGLLNDIGNLTAKGLKDRGKDVFLVAEMGVKAAHGAARLGHDHGHGGGVVAIAGKEAGSGFKQGAVADLLAGDGGGGVPVSHFSIDDLKDGCEEKNDVSFYFCQGRIK